MGQPTLHMESWLKNLQNLDLMYLGDAIDDSPRTWAFLQISYGVDIFWIDEILKFQLFHLDLRQYLEISDILSKF